MAGKGREQEDLKGEGYHTSPNDMIMSNGKEARLNSRYFGGSRAGERM